MKLRCVNNSIRLRVKKSDLQELEEAGFVMEMVSFQGTGLFSFCIMLFAKTEKVYATFDKSQITVYLPLALAQNWMNSNQVGIEVNNELDNGDFLHILIEKDFPCVDREDEDKSDTFFELANQKLDVC